MKNRHLVLIAIVILTTACTEQTRRSAIGWLKGSGREAASEGARIALTAAYEAASTGAPIARTLAAEGVPLAGTLSAEVISSGAPIAGTAVAGGLDALSTRVADQPGYRCPSDIYTVDFDLNQTIDISGPQLAAAIAATVPGSPLTGLGQAFVDAGRGSNVNAYFLAALAAWETNWGAGERYVQSKNVFDYGGITYDSETDSINRLTPLIKADFLTPGGRFYNGATLNGIAPGYGDGTTDWAESVATIMQLLRQNTPCPQ